MRKIIVTTVLAIFLGTTGFSQPGLKIGVLVPRTGELRNIGINFIRGLRLGVKEPVVIRVFDTGGNISKSKRILSYLKNQDIDLIVGPLTSREIYGVLSDISQLSIPVYSPLAYLPNQCELGNLFGPIKGLCAKVDYLLSVIEKNSGMRGVLVYSKSPEGIALSLYMRDALKKKGLIKNWDFLSFDETDFSYSFIDAHVDSTKPDILLVQSDDVAMLGVVNYVRYLGYRGPVITLKNLFTDSTILNGLKLDTVYFIAAKGIEQRDSEIFSQFRRDYKNAYNEEPDFAAIRGFETGFMIDTIYNLYKSGNTSIYKVLKNLGKVPGESGYYLISDEGDLIFYFVTKGKIKEVTPDVIIKSKKEQKAE